MRHHKQIQKKERRNLSKREGKKFMGTARTTFLINEKGVITDIIGNVDTANHASQIINN